MTTYVRMLGEVDGSLAAAVGGKAARLGEVAHIEDVLVPRGLCVTTDAFRQATSQAAPRFHDVIDQLSRLGPEDTPAIRKLSTRARQIIEDTEVPRDVAEAIAHGLVQLGGDAAYAIRSSATAEDLPTTSFAGQHDTHLGIVGRDAVLDHVRRCWASLFTERAVTYRLRHGVDHRQESMAVLVQRMVNPQASGVLFTADPVSGHRRVARVEAVVGLGEALVSGMVTPDAYEVRAGTVASRTIAGKTMALQMSSDGGTEQVLIPADRQSQPVLTDDQVLRLVDLGRRLETHLGEPQDVEWCLAEDGFWILQCRPITTLFPIPDVEGSGNHVFISVGHQQMMTDAMRPLGLSFWRLTSPAPMREAGSRLFVDVTQHLASPASRTALLHMAGRSDPLIATALQRVIDCPDFLPPAPQQATSATPAAPDTPAGNPPADVELGPAIVTDLVQRTEVSLAQLKEEIRGKSGPGLVDFIVDDIQELRRLLVDPESHRAIMASMEATWWLNDRLHEWLGENNAAGTLAQSVPDNVTSQMGFALLDVADHVRPHPDVVAFLEQVDDDDWLDGLPELAGGQDAQQAIRTFLDRYGARCVGEIDITRPRWIEHPTALVPSILVNVRSFEPGAGSRRFEDGRREAEAKRAELLDRLRALPDGDQKAAEAGRMIDQLRAFAGYREFPKFGMVRRYLVYRQALLAEARRLVEAGILNDHEEIFYLTVEELRDVVESRRADHARIARRREAFKSHELLTPPRVITSDGEVIRGTYGRDEPPADGMVGLAVSPGTVEGRARVVARIDDADLQPGDILVTAYTDPSWTPALVAVAGLVTEVGGLMTHGAVIAREYGLPAVVGVEHATRRIQDRQQIRVDGTNGLVTLLASEL